MVTNTVNQVYSVEEKLKNAIKQNDIAKYEEIQRKYSGSLKLHSASTNITENVLNTYFSEDLYDLLVHGNYDTSGFEKIDEGVIESYRKYVEKELDVDLSKVDIFFIDDYFETSDGWAMPCKENEHYIVLGADLKTNFLSDDIVIHELGHTAEFCIRRNNLEGEAKLANYKIISETVAHYSQFKYLTTQSLDKRVSVLASIVQIAPLLEIIKYCLSYRVKNWSIDGVVNSENFKTLRKFYSREKLSFMIRPYSSMDIGSLYHIVVEPRLGSILALSLLNNKDAIKSLCLADTNKSLKVIFEDLGLNSNKLLDFSKADEILKRFIFQS